MNTQLPSIFSSASCRQRGFTLIELLVALSIAAILLAVGIPSFRSTIASNRLTSTTNDLVGTLAQARSEAIKRGVRVTVCRSNNSTSCNNPAAGANHATNHWQQGWIVFLDSTRSGTTASVDTGETIIAVTGAATSTVIRGSADLKQYVSFSSDGTTRLMTGGVQTGTLRVCEPSSALTDANRAREIQVAASGRLTTIRPSSVADTCRAP